MLLATAGYVLLPTSVVWANPTGEQVVGGAATFDRQGNNLTVNQKTDRLAVNWQDFSIAAGERTHFNMPSAASIALNRVLGGNPSQIYGTLSSNGNIILVNNSGIFVGPGGVVNAASFVGSTLDIDPGQFMKGGQDGYQLHGNSYAPIVNQGNITAEKGDVFLIAQKVENRGTISAPNGTAALVGAGQKTEVVLHEVGGSGFAVRVAQLEGEAASGSNHNLPDGEELLNEGEISAAQAELSASGNIYALAIKNTGTIRAKAVVANADGTVRLDGGLGDVINTGKMYAKNAGDNATAAGGKIDVAGKNVTASPESIITAAGGEQGGDGGKVKIDSADTTIVQGKVDVAAPSAGAKGGKVELLGERVGLLGGAKVDASGGAGGGTVLVGGDYLGGQTPKAELKDLAKQETGPVKNAKATVMADTAEIKADATVNGDGGKIILWSDEYTGFYGQLFARGGAEGGDGGFVETSSKNNLQAFGNVLLQAASGSGGHWLLDPLNVSIVSTGGTSIPVGGGTFNPTTADTQVNAGSIVTAIQGGNNVTITTFGSQVISNPDGSTSTINQDGDINVGADITIAAGQPAYGSLTLTATRNIAVNAAINFGNATASIVTLETGSAGGISGGGQITLNSTGGLRLVSGSGGTSVQINNPLVAGVVGGIAAVSTGNISITGTATSVIPVVTIGGTIGISTPGNIDLIGQTAILGGSTLIGANVNIFADADFQFESNRFAGAVQTTQRQRYQGAVTFTENTVLSSGQDIVFRSTVDGPGEVILIVGRQTDLIDLVGSLVVLGAFRQEGGLINFYAEGTSSEPSINVGGSATFDSANLVLWENTFLRSSSDVIFGGDINSSFFDVPAVFDVATTGGNIIFDGQVGSTAALGNLTVEAGGTGQIALNQGATTLPGNSPVNDGADGAIRLITENNSVVLAGTIDTRGGLSVGSVLGGNLEVSAGGDGSNIQLEGTIRTRGGTMDFNNSVFISAAAFLDNTEADTRGTITFDDSVFFGGNLSLVSGGAVAFNGDVNGANDVSILVQNDNNLTFAGNLGNTIPLGSLTVQTGGGDVILSSDISTGGGAVSFGMRVRLGDNVTIDTTKLNNANGGRVEFLQGVVGEEVMPGSFVNGQGYLITSLGGANEFASVGATVVAATALEVGKEYIITTSGSTNFIDVGATSNAIGTVFTATGVGSGTGSTLLTYFTATGAGAGSGTANQLNDLVVNGGITGVVGFGASAQAPQYSGRINSLTVLNAGSFSVTSALEGFGENADGNALDFLPSFNSTLAGSVNILKSVGSGDILLRNGINTSFPSAKAGSVTLESVGTGEVVIRGSVAMNGGSNLLGTIGFDGGDLIVNSKANFVMPTSISNTGGDGSFSDGKAGNVTIETTSGSGNISFSSGIFDVIQDSQYTLAAGGSVILGILADPDADLFSSNPADLRISGTVLQLNRTAQGTDFSLASRGSFNVGYGGSLDADQDEAYFYAPSGSAILTFGGTVGIVRLHNLAAPSYDLDRNINGLPQLGGVNLNGQTITTVEGLASGNVSINQVALKREITGSRDPLLQVVSGVVLTGAITTRGGTPPEETIVGLKGGDVRIAGTSVFLNGRINTAGSNSLDGGEDAIGIGGTGGTVDITGTEITIVRDITTSGGRGISQLSGAGGPGGAITLGGPVILDSGNGVLTTIIFNTQGGLGLGTGDEGAGGNILSTGSITGTQTTSNTLDLRYGNGTATLGDAPADTITLGTLITAADDERSTGRLFINGALNVDTLTTFGRGYGISILGNGSQITQNVSFLNTGVVALGSAGGTVTFSGGFDAASGTTAPASVRLAGTIVSGPGTGAGMVMDTVFLDALTQLNSNNNAIQMGSIDGAFGLTLLSGIAGSSVEIGGVVGGTTRLGAITVQTGLTQVLFSQAVNAASFSTISGSVVTLEGNLNLTGALNLAGSTTLRSVDADAALAVTTTGGTISGSLALEKNGGDGVSITSSGVLDVSGAVAGAVNLALAGAGAKTFSAAVTVGSGTGASLAIGGGEVSFAGLTTAGGITSSSALTFNNNVNLDTAGTGTTALGVAVTLGGVNFNAGGAVGMSGPITLTGDSTLTGAGTYDITGTVTGAGRALLLAGTGNKSFSNTVGLASISQAGSAATAFSGNVILTDGADFAGGVTLTGNTFTAANQVDFAGLTVSGGTATVDGSALYNFNGAVTGSAVLAMSGIGTKTFASTVGTAGAGLGGLQETGGGIVNLRGNVFTSSDSSFAGRVNLRGIAFTTGGLTVFNGRVTLENTGATLQGNGSFDVAGNVEGTTAGSQTLTLAQGGLKTFGGTVGNLVALKGIQHSGGTTAFNNTVRTRGNSTFGGQVELSGMTFDAQVANTSTRFNQGATLNGGAVALGGSGNFAFATDVIVGVNSALTMNGAAANQTFTFAGDLGTGGAGTLTSLTQTGGKMVVGSGSSSTVQTTGNVALANLSTRGAVTVDSSGSDQQFDVLGLGGNFTSAADGATVTYGTVTGSGNMNTTAGQLALAGAVRNSGSFAAGQDGAVVLGAGGFLSDTGFANLLSSGGATFTSNLADVEVNDVQAKTGLTLVSRTGDVIVNGLTSTRSLGIQAFGTADLAGLTQVQSLRLLEADQLGVDGLDNLDASALGRVTLTTGGLTYNRANGVISLQGLIDVPGEVIIGAAGGVVNVSGVANPFRSTGSVTLVSPDLFNRSLQNPLIPGARLVRGTGGAVSGEPGVTIFYDNFDNFLPYSSEFTTGTGQPYILATQQNAVPGVMMPAAYTVAGAFPARVSYSAEELEMMTPEERSAYEAQQRRQSARVILERQPGQPEVGVPAEGEIPQASAPEAEKPAPTAQVILDGKPLAGTPAKEKNDSTQILRLRPAKAVALRAEMDVHGVMEKERLAAEVNVGSAPVAGR